MRSFSLLPTLQFSTLSICLVFCPIVSSPVLAQITPDSTLGAESSIVTPNQTIKDLPADLIEGGAARGANLFHSFLEFNVNDGQRVYFANPSGVATIFSRVTGSNISNIFGTLGVNGGADLFFLNPNGIIFGPGAQLDISGSFVGTTAESILFGDGIEFSAVNPTAPPLLTVNLPPTGLQFGPNAGDIVLQGGEAPQLVVVDEGADAGQLLATAQAVNPELTEVPNQIQGTLETEGDVDLYQVFLPAGSTIAPSTVGGSSVDTRLFLFDAQGLGVLAVEDSEGTLQSTLPAFTATESGVVYVGIGSYANSPLSVEGEIFAYDGDNFVFTGPGVGATAPLSEWDGSGFDSGAYTLTLSDVAAPIANFQIGSGETFALIGGNVHLAGQRLVLPGRDVQLGGLSGVGEVAINRDLNFVFPAGVPQAEVSLTAGAEINVREAGGGSIGIQGSTVRMDNSKVFAGINAGFDSEDGVGGDIEIIAVDSVELINTTISNSISQGGSGRSGNVTIVTDSLSLRDGATLNASTFGFGDAGRIEIRATHSVSLSGESNNSPRSGIFSQVQSTAVGSVSGITIDTANLSLGDGARINTSTFGVGDAGAMAIRATDSVSIFGNNSQGLGSGIFSVVEAGAVGSSEGITLDAGSLSLETGGAITASTLGEGDAGAVVIRVTDSVSISGEDNRNGFVSGIFSNVNAGAVGNAGGITLDAGSLSLETGGVIFASTSGEGDAGSVTIRATDSISLISEGSRGVLSGIFSEVYAGAVGNAGGITIDTGSLSLLDGAQVSASTFGEGDAGVVVVTTTGDMVLSGEDSQGFPSRISSQVDAEAVGNAGGITIDTASLSLLDGGEISASTFGDGDAGAIDITATGDISLSGESSQGLVSGIFSAVQPGGEGIAGGITIDAGSLSLLDGGGISASTFGDGDAGAIVITTTGDMVLSGEDSQGLGSGISSDVSAGAVGSAGGITIEAGSLSLLDGAQVAASTFGKGDAGVVAVTTTGDMVLSGEDSQGFSSGIFSQVISEAVGNAGGITIEAGSLSLLDGGKVAASTFGDGGAGAIGIEVADDIVIQGEDRAGNASAITAAVMEGAIGNSDNISLSASRLTLLENGAILAFTEGQGNAGAIDLDITEQVTLGEGTSLSVETRSSGTPGSIAINTPDLIIADNAQLSATVTASSTNTTGGGNITLNVSDLDISGRLGIFAETNSLAPAGNLAIQPNGTNPNLNIRFSEDGFISASTTAVGDGGSVTLTAPEQIEVSGDGRIAVSTSGAGQAGQINLTAPTIILRDGVTISGSTSGTGQGGRIAIQARDTLNLNTATIEATTTPGSTGNGGDIFIDPITTTLTNSRIALDSQGTGTGGNLQLISNFLTLDRSEISASTASSDGGSLTLSVPALLTLQNGSIISTQAGTAGAGGNGGNITIDSKLIVGSSNSDIIANAFEGNGGNITINTQGLFGFTVENTDTPRTNLTSDITASSQFGVSSTPNISQAIDPAQSLAVLDTTVADLSNQIDRRCDLVGTPNASRFVITGKGGLPPNDRNRLSLTPLWTALDLTSDSTDPGQSWYKQGNYAEAIDSWETALQSSDLPLEQQVTLHANLAQAYATQGDWNRATEAIDRGLNRLNHHSNPNDGLLNRLRARLLTTQSYLLTERGQLNQAFNLSEEAHRLYQEQNDRFGILQTQLNQAQILTRQGNFRQASDRLTTIQNSLEPTENDSLTAAIELELGTVQRLLGNYTAAQTALERSEALFSEISPVYQTATRLALGDNDRDQFVPLNRQFNNLQEQIALVPPGSRGEIQTRARSVTTVYETVSNQALTQYRQAQTTAPTPDQRLQALTQEFLMTIDLIAARRTPDWSAVKVLQEKLQDQSSQLPLSSTRLYARLNLAGGLLELQEKNATVVTPEDLTGLLAQTLQDADTLGDRRAKTQALNQLARLYEQQQQWGIAQEFNKAALALAQEDGEADLTYRLLWQLGRLQYAQGQTEEAIVSYTESINTLNTLRSDINTSSTEVRFSFRDAVDPIYRELVSLLLSQNTAETPRPENVVQARNLIESLQLSELVNFFQADCDVSNLAQIDELDPHSAIIYPIILSDRLEVIVSLPGQPLQHYAAPLPESNLIQGIYAIQRGLSDPVSRQYLPLVQKLYDAIIRPVEAELSASNIENLVFVLDGPLRNIPMSVLHDGDRFLIEKYAIALTPGLQLFNPQPLQQQELKVLLGGLTQARQGFSALPNVQAEIASIGSTLPGNVLLDDLFVEENLRTEIGSSPFPVVHLATHGEFGSTAEDTFILTWDDRFTANEFSQLLQSRSGGQPIELLILSACRTATGDDRAALGLAGIAVRSGARSTLASLWYISDEATSVLMSKLYAVLGEQNTTKAEAVRQAQLELLQNPQYANPYYWAPFVLVGNWL